MFDVAKQPFWADVEAGARTEERVHGLVDMPVQVDRWTTMPRTQRSIH